MSDFPQSDVILSVFARTDVGMQRRGNEDCFLVADLTTGHMGLIPEVSTHRLGALGSLLVVSDGMGGAAAGEIASDMAVNSLREELLKNANLADVTERLRRSVEASNNCVHQHGVKNPHLAGMGATLTAVLCYESRAYIAQVGDSRAYLVRNKRIKQLTKDQSLVQLLMDAGAIRPDQASQIPNNVILQALGTRPDVVVAMTSIDLCAMDYLLLCSDGLSNKVSSEEMRDILVRHEFDLAGACRSLIELANARGGEDNITAVVARFDGTALSSASEGRSITGSFRELTSNDLLRIGGAQLDYFHDPASDVPTPTPDLGIVLDDVGVKLVPSTTTPQVGMDDPTITQIAMPALPASAMAPPPGAPPAAVTAPLASPAQTAPLSSRSDDGTAVSPETSPLPKTGVNKLLLGVGVLFILVALLSSAAFLVYWFVLRNGH